MQPKRLTELHSDFSTINCIHTNKKITKRSNEFGLPLCVAFVDHEKAFESISSLAVMDVLRNSNIDSACIHLTENIYKEVTAKLKLHKMCDTFSIRKGVRQDYTTSLKLINAVLK